MRDWTSQYIRIKHNANAYQCLSCDSLNISGWTKWPHMNVLLHNVFKGSGCEQDYSWNRWFKVGVQQHQRGIMGGAACCRSLHTKLSFVFWCLLRPPGALRGHASFSLLQCRRHFASNHKTSTRLSAGCFVFLCSASAALTTDLIIPTLSLFHDAHLSFSSHRRHLRISLEINHSQYPLLL